MDVDMAAAVDDPFPCNRGQALAVQWVHMHVKAPKSLAADRERCVCSMVRQAARRVSAMYDAALAPAGLTITNYLLLVRIDRQAGIGVSELAAQIVMDRTTLSRNLQPLMRDGLVTNAAGPDRRRRTLRITARGQARLRSASKHWQRAQRTFKQRYGADRTQALLAAIDGVLEVA